VPEVELKWNILRASQEHFNFSPADELLQFAQRHGMLFRGHPLVWHERLPSWFSSRVGPHNAEIILQEHIVSVVRHYENYVHSWDVVNEAILLADNQTDGLRNSPWLQLLGPDYIDFAFHTAAAADPQAILVYNDYQLDYATADHEKRRSAVLRLLERLKSRKVPVHALGIQAHLYADETRFDSSAVSAFLRDVAKLGLKILISELDVTDRNLPSDPIERGRRVAEVYYQYLSTVLQEPAVIAVLTWGLSDRYTWLSSVRPRRDGFPVRSLPFDVDLKSKSVWKAMARAFDEAPVR